jgi:hypothetical protein
MAAATEGVMAYGKDSRSILLAISSRLMGSGSLISGCLRWVSTALSGLSSVGVANPPSQLSNKISQVPLKSGEAIPSLIPLLTFFVILSPFLARAFIVSTDASLFHLDFTALGVGPLKTVTASLIR